MPEPTSPGTGASAERHAAPVLFDYWRSSASYRVRIALNLAGIAHEVVTVDLLAGAHRQAAHVARNPQGLVPVLDIDGRRFTQSLAIVEYLDETRGLGLLPEAPAERAAVRAIAHSLAVDVHPVCNLSVVARATGGEEPARSAWMRHYIEPGLRAFETLLAGTGGGPFCTGRQPSLADVCLIPQLYNADRWGADYADCERIRAAATACAGHPAFADARPDAVEPA